MRSFICGEICFTPSEILDDPGSAPLPRRRGAPSLVVSSFCPSVSWMVPSEAAASPAWSWCAFRETMITVRQLPGADLQLSKQVAHPANERSVLGQEFHPIALRAVAALLTGHVTDGRGAYIQLGEDRGHRGIDGIRQFLGTLGKPIGAPGKFVGSVQRGSQSTAGCSIPFLNLPGPFGCERVTRTDLTKAVGQPLNSFFEFTQSRLALRQPFDCQGQFVGERP